MHFSVRIRDIFDNHMQNMPVRVSGWVRSVREMGPIVFLALSDQSSMQPLQIVIENNQTLTHQAKTLTTGSSITAEGIVSRSPAKGQDYELKASSIAILGIADESYPLQKKRHSFEYLRTIPHLRPRSNTFAAIARIRHAVFMAIHEFCNAENFINIQTPIITQADAEGTGELFQVVHGANADFFGSSSYLTVSGQLAAEAMACALGRVYTLGPTFRAENSNTSRHLSEFWMLELEAAFVALNENCAIAEKLIQHIVCSLLDAYSAEMEFFTKFIDPDHHKQLETIVNAPFERLEYDATIKILSKADVSFQYEPIWGIDLQSEHEHYLTEVYCKRPVVVTNYPKETKAFYMRLNDDEKTVAAVDILIPRFGELVGGSQREERLDVLEKRMHEYGINPDEYAWYLDLRRYGTVPHSGFGLGIERLIQCVTSMTNIRDVIPFPRTPGQAFA